MQNKRRIIGIVAAAFLALIGTFSLVSYVQSAKDKAVAQEALVDVYIVDELVPKGADADIITSSVTLEQVPSRLVQANAILELGEVGDDVAATDLQPGDQLVSARLASRDAVFEEVTDKVQISARLDAERAVGGSLQKGDLVGVYLSFDPFDQVDLVDIGLDVGPDGDELVNAVANANEASTLVVDKSPNVTGLEFQHVLVTNVQTIAAPVIAGSNDEDEPAIAQVTGNQYVVTLALSPEESERFVFATEFGHVWLSIEPASVADDGTRPVTLGDVYKVVK